MAWGLAHISSYELSEWQAYYQNEAYEAEAQRDIEDSGDGKMIHHGRPEDDDEPEDESS